MPRRRSYRPEARYWAEIHRRRKKKRASTAWVVAFVSSPLWTIPLIIIDEGYLQLVYVVGVLMAFAMWASYLESTYSYYPRGVRPAPGYRQGPRGPIVGLTKREWARIQRRWQGNCAYCGDPAPAPHREHDIPLMRGGMHEATNIVPACAICNQQKGIRTGAEYVEWRIRGRLPVNPRWERNRRRD
jgi:hypothetical protein